MRWPPPTSRPITQTTSAATSTEAHKTSGSSSPVRSHAWCLTQHPGTSSMFARHPRPQAAAFTDCAVTTPPWQPFQDRSDCPPLDRMRKAKANSIRLFRKEDPVSLAVKHLLVNNPGRRQLGVQLAPERIHVTDREPAARLL